MDGRTDRWMDAPMTDGDLGGWLVDPDERERRWRHPVFSMRCGGGGGGGGGGGDGPVLEGRAD